MIQRENAQGRTRVLDPFAGSGTVLLEAEFAGLESVGVESHPFVARVGRAKLQWKENPQKFRKFALQMLEEARGKRRDQLDYPKLILSCYPPDTLRQLDSLLKTWQELADESCYSELAWLALVSILRECSPAGTAQWQYVLPNKTKAKSREPYEAFNAKVHLMANDMMICKREVTPTPAVLYQEDARDCLSVADASIDLVITSPPYANNYDYADATRLEMTFLGEIAGWGGLQDAVRKYLVRSCTQHVSKLKGSLELMLGDPLLAAIQHEIAEVCHQLQNEKQLHGGKKNYDLMLAAYFSDLARVWRALRRVSKKNCLVCWVVGDSAPYGVHAPIERWLGELALAAGFKSYTFEKTRSRNIKWKNRKHRVPLQEGRLWVEG